MGAHRTAIEKTLRAGGRALDDRHAALVELCRALAAQMDSAGDAGPSSRVSAAYLSALKDLNRALLATAPRQTGGSRLTLLQERAGARRAGTA